MQDGFRYIERNQRLAPSSAITYRAKDGTCNYRSKPNGLKTKVTGQNSVPSNERGHMSALAKGPLAVAFEVTDKCQQYRSGIFKDTTCRGAANHAVTMVGYDNQKFAIKNSWGTGWGSRGYIYMARNYHNCRLYGRSAIITMTRSDPEPAPDPSPDPGPDPSPDPGPDPGPDPDPDCRDTAGSSCRLNTRIMCKYFVKQCMKTCGKC